MIRLVFGEGAVTIDPESGEIASLTYREKELAKGRTPLFRAKLRTPEGKEKVIDAGSGKLVACTEPETADESKRRMRAEYLFDRGTRVIIDAEASEGMLSWNWSAKIPGEDILEWIECPRASLAPLKGEGGEAEMLFPYNEGAVVDSLTLKESTHLHARNIEYPSLGSYQVFPNMICSQFQAYLMPGCGLYMGAHDPYRGFKYIDFTGNGEGVLPLIRVYPSDYGMDGINYEQGFPLIWKFFDGQWQDAAEIYREWFENELPAGVKKIKDNDRLPAWYDEMPFVVSYPVRGIHDMDEMKPNALFPYINALPVIDRIQNMTGAKVLALLMHWEGTAPWAPPYVWPPYGGEAAFNEFRDALHESGNLLGVYCSGFSYTIDSHVDKYNREEDYEREGLEAAMCAGPDGKVELSRICTGQRTGYDICAASEKGDGILTEAYTPLFNAGIDYAQILDQNHGGGQYLCYSKNHGHPPVPGRWMTVNMQKLLKKWRDASEGMLLGCESASAEPFMGNLPFSDNRFELNWFIGRPVPLSAYIYHEYMHNFMGNQVCSPFPQSENSLFLRLAYSFVAGDCLTIVLTPDGRIMDHWGGRDFNTLPDKDEVLAFVRSLTHFAKGEAKDYLSRGRMVKPLHVDCPSHDFTVAGRMLSVPDVFTGAFSLGGKRVQILVNHTSEDVLCDVAGQKVCVKARNAAMTEI